MRSPSKHSHTNSRARWGMPYTYDCHLSELHFEKGQPPVEVLWDCIWSGWLARGAHAPILYTLFGFAYTNNIHSTVHTVAFPWCMHLTNNIAHRNGLPPYLRCIQASWYSEWCKHFVVPCMSVRWWKMMKVCAYSRHGDPNAHTHTHSLEYTLVKRWKTIAYDGESIMKWRQNSTSNYHYMNINL